MIRLSFIADSISLMMLLFGVVILSPIIIALVFGEYSAILPFVVASIISIAVSFLLKKLTKNKPKYDDLKRTEGLFIVALTWIVASFIAAIPYLFFGLGPVNSLFEAVSGITTTGATILTDFSLYPKTFFFWRSLTQWLGGMGIIVLFIAVLPQLAVAGRQLLFAEAPGPTEDKLTPRVRHTASALWIVYIVLTILEVFLLIWAKMPWFDAVCNSLSTMAAGGFSPNPESIMGYNSHLVEWIVTGFMFLAGANYALHYSVLFKGKIKEYFTNSEFKTYFGIVLIASVILADILFLEHNYIPIDSIRHSLFQILSIITTAGFASADFEFWTTQAKVSIFLMMLIGGCAGSAGGGIKVVRILLGAKYLKREISKILHPKSVIQIKLDKKVIAIDVIRQIIAFIFFYFVILIASSAVVSLIEGNAIIGITGTAATVGNIGPGFGAIGPMGSYNDLSLVTKFIFMLNMIIGRLELIPFLVMLHPDFWNFKNR